jgi:hypothetical protein
MEIQQCIMCTEQLKTCLLKPLTARYTTTYRRGSALHAATTTARVNPQLMLDVQLPFEDQTSIATVSKQWLYSTDLLLYMCTAAAVQYCDHYCCYYYCCCSPDVRASLSLATMGATLRELGEEGVDNGMKTTRTVSSFNKQHTTLQSYYCNCIATLHRLCALPILTVHALAQLR